MHLPQGPICALLLIAALTGGLHEDGLADVCDAVRAYRSRQTMMEILHDSRIGAHGALAIVFSVLVRWQALEHLIGNAWIKLAVVFGVSRGSIVLLAACTPAAGSGLGPNFRASLSRRAVWIAGLQVIALSALAGLIGGSWLAATCLLMLQAVILLATRRWFLARLGGITGDCLGFQCQVSEAAALLLFTWV